MGGDKFTAALLTSGRGSIEQLWCNKGLKLGTYKSEGREKFYSGDTGRLKGMVQFEGL